MDAGFDENEAEFGIFVFSIALEMFANCNSLWRTVRQHLLFDWRRIVFDVCGVTFLINIYRSSGISGASPIEGKSLCQSKTKQRHSCEGSVEYDALPHGWCVEPISVYRTIRFENPKNLVT